MPPAGNKAVNYGIVGAGVVIAWAALINRSVVGTLQDLIAGKQPTGGPGFQATNVIGGTGSLGDDAGTVSGNIQNTAKRLLGIFGWSDQWASFNKLESGEGGWNPTAENRTTGFFGLAQAGNHGGTDTASPTRVHKYGLHKGQPVNNYGGYGLSATEAQQANSGAAEPQLKWMLNYIRTSYNDPNHAYLMWLSRNPHWY